ncbi:hypothetical protein ACFS4T_10385 [Pseudomonas lini]
MDLPGNKHAKLCGGINQEKKSGKDDVDVGRFANDHSINQQAGKKTQTWREVSLTPRSFIRHTIV